MQRVKILVNIIDFSSPLEFSKLCLMIEGKIIMFSDVVLSIYRGNIIRLYNNTIRLQMGEGKGT